MTNYQRVILTGTITSQSNLHIGTGEEYIQIDEKNPKNKITFNTVCLDAQQKPYIPASSLRGYLRHIVEQQEGQESEAVKVLFGLARQKKGTEDSGNIGQLRIYDARWEQNITYEKRLISQTSIDPISNTAREHQLFTHEVVPPKSVFNVTIEIDVISEELISIILKALNTLNQTYGGRLGKAKNNGQGEVTWKQKELKVLSNEDFIEWLKQTKQKDLGKYFQTDTNFDIKAEYENKNYTNIAFQLTANSPLLIVDKPFSLKEEKRRKNENKANEDVEGYTPLFKADLYFTQSDNYAVIPSATIKGWVRARCRKIISTLLHKKAKTGGGVSLTSINDEIDKKINQLFGNTQAQGLLQFTDVKIKLEDYDIHQQTFNAIDRFTGGAAKTALYNVEAIWPKSTFKIDIRYHQEKIENWMKLLLIFIIRDAMQGDLVLGWGKSKGYGRLSLTSNTQKGWASYYQTLKFDENKIIDMQNDLNAVVESLIEKPVEEIAS